VNPPGSRFCNACGRNLAQPLAPATSFASPTSYTPKHLAEKILTSRTALEGERKQVTVLFADVADSSQLVQQVDPEVLHQVLRLMAEEATAASFAGFAFGFVGEFESAFLHAGHGLHLDIQNPFAEAAAYFYRALVHEQRGAWT